LFLKLCKKKAQIKKRKVSKKMEKEEEGGVEE
jgi:hypothetical protein